MIVSTVYEIRGAHNTAYFSSFTYVKASNQIPALQLKIVINFKNKYSNIYYEIFAKFIQYHIPHFFKKQLLIRIYIYSLSYIFHDHFHEFNFSKFS